MELNSVTVDDIQVRVDACDLCNILSGAKYAAQPTSGAADRNLVVAAAVGHVLHT